MSQCEAAESSSQVNPQVIDGKERSSLDEVLRQGARQMLVKAVEAEVTAYIQAHQHEVDEDGRRLVVRNGHARERTLVSGAGQLKIQAPRVDDRRVDERGQRFRFIESTFATVRLRQRRTKGCGSREASLMNGSVYWS